MASSKTLAFAVLLQGLNVVLSQQPYTVYENATVGTVVYSVAQPKCKVANTDGAENYFTFEHNNATSVCVVKETPDLESSPWLCGTYKLIALEIKCWEDGSFGQTYQLKVISIDEFPPQFNRPDYNATLKEEQPIGSQVRRFTTEVTDKDCGDNDFVYNIQAQDSDSDHFTMNIDEVLSAGVFDYDTGDKQYTITIRAENDPNKNSGSIQTASATLIVNIEDIDDMNPAFTHPSYTLNIQEENDTLIGTSLMTSPPIHAYDQDFGINQSIIFSLTDADNFITIYNISGNIMVNQTFDRETIDSYSYTIKASQSDNDQRIAVARLEVIIEDINDNHAIFSQPNLETTIPENLATGSIITVVQASDADVSENAAFKYTISGNIFSIDSMSGVIKVENSTALDRETNDQVSVEISTTPEIPVISSDPCALCNLTLIVSLTDENDNTPVFTLPSGYIFAITENVAGETVGTVSAIDKDLGDNARVTYVTETNYETFRVNTTSGEITLVKQTVIPVNFLIKACDNPTNLNLRRCSTGQATVVKKDNTTVQGHDIIAAITENQPTDSIVADIPFFSSYFTFKLQNNEEFRLEKSVIKTKVVLDREKQLSYSLQLQIINGSTVVNTYSVNITIHDVNDNLPIFDEDKYSFILLDGLAQNSVIGQVKANDADEGSNGKVTYYVEGQSPTYFAIGKFNGEISLLSYPDLSFTQQFIALVVRAADSGKPSLQSFTTVQIYVGDDNSTLPIQVVADKEFIEKERDSLEKSMSEILDVNILMRNVSSYGAGSIIYISATNITDGSEIQLNELSRRVEDNIAAIQKLFMNNIKVEQPPASSGLSTESIVLIGIACAILIGSIFLISVTYYKFKKYQRLQRLVHNLSRKNSIYETQETSIAIEDEVSQYDKSDSISQRHLIRDVDLPNGHAVGMVNAAYTSQEPESETNVSSGDNTGSLKEYPDGDGVGNSLEPDRDYNDLGNTLSPDSPERNVPDPDADYEPDTGEPEIDDQPHVETVSMNNEPVYSNIMDMPLDEPSPPQPLDTSSTEPIYSQVTPRQVLVTPPPPPPPLPEDFSPMIQSSSVSDLPTAGALPLTEGTPKSTQYENVLLELQAAVHKKKRNDDDENDDEIKVEDSRPPIKFENWTENVDLVGQTKSTDDEEPEPDYAKKVRFSEAAVIENHSKPVDDTDGENPELRQSDEIHSPHDYVNGESGTFVFGELEITEL